MTTPLLLLRDEDWLANLFGVAGPLLHQLELNSPAPYEGEEVWDVPLDQVDGSADYDARLRIWDAAPDDRANLDALASLLTALRFSIVGGE